MQREDERQSNLEAALEYGRRGWPVLPVKGKKALIKNWPEAATTDEAQINKWWGVEWPDANIGILTGSRSGLITLDVDVKKTAGDETLRSLEERNGSLPETLMARTPSGGWHYVFRMPTGKVGSKKPIWTNAGIDLLADRSYFVAAPSTIGNKSYQWGEMADVAPCPEWVAALGQNVAEDSDEDSPEDRLNGLILEVFPNRKRSGKYWMVLCPYHDDKLASLSITGKTGNFRCFSCPARGTFVELLVKKKGISKEEAEDLVTPVPWYVHELNKRHAIIPVGNNVEIIREDHDALGNYLGVSFPNQEAVHQVMYVLQVFVSDCKSRQYT